MSDAAMLSSGNEPIPTEALAGEFVPVPREASAGPLIEPTEEGGLVIQLEGEGQQDDPQEVEFYTNLAELLSDSTMGSVVQELLQRVEEDKESRKDREEKYAEGIRRTGLGDDAPGGASFQGASRAVHPMMTEATIDYESRIIRELFPTAGPVRPQIVGKPTAAKADKAQRKTDYMNWQLTQQIREARSVLETTLTQVPLGGSQFIRQVWDHRLKRPTWEFVPIDRMFIPFGAASFETAHRKTFWETVPEVEFRRRVEQGLYVDAGLGAPGIMDESTGAQSANDKVEGRSDPGSAIDTGRDLYEVTVQLEVTEALVNDLPPEARYEKAGDICPYIITIDKTTRRAVGWYRAWAPDDDAREEIQHIFEWQFIPWRGAFGIGFPHIIGGLSAAATGALRALLDAAHVNNMVGGLVLKGSGVGGQNVTATPGSFMEIEGGLEADDIRKRVMQFSVNPPSTVLFSLLQFVVESARGVVKTALEDTPNSGVSPMPVGTQLSKVEEALVVFTAIHGRAHAALNRMLQGLHRLNRLYLPKEVTLDIPGKDVFVRRSDFEGPIDVQPVSDPTIYSDAQRWAQVNYIQMRAAQVPGLYNLRNVELAGLRLIRWVDPESLLQPAPQPVETNAVNEGLAMVMGMPVQVFPAQDHLAHIQVHLDFLRSPVLGQNPAVAPAALPAAIVHIAHHLAHLYVQRMMQTVGDATQMDPMQLMSPDPAIKTKFDQLLAAASAGTVENMDAQLGQAIPLIQQIAKMASEMGPKQPVDPAAAALEAAKGETARKAQADQVNAEIGQAKVAVAAEGNQIKRESAELASATKLAVTHANNQAAEDVAAMKIGTGEGTHFTDGDSMGSGG